MFVKLVNKTVVNCFQNKQMVLLILQCRAKIIKQVIILKILKRKQFTTFNNKSVKILKIKLVYI